MMSEPRVEPRSGILTDIEWLLRDRQGLLRHVRDATDDPALASLVRSLLITVAAACAAFGAALGAYRGSEQILFAAVKLPLVMLGTAAVCTPTLTAFNAALGRPAALRRDVALVLIALAAGSLVLVSLAPVVLLTIQIGVSYHALALVVFGCCSLAGVASLAVLGRGVGLAAAQRAGSAILALSLVFAVVGAQLAWTMRPYLVRPRAPEVPFVRAIDGSLVEAVSRSLQSSRGIYTREHAPLPGLESAVESAEPEVWEP